MTTEIDLTEFRRDLTAVIDQLHETGPVRLIRYGDTVAEVHAADPAARTAYTRQLADTFTRLTAMEASLSEMIDGGLTVGDMTELLARVDNLSDQGATFDLTYVNLYPLPGGPLTVDDVLATWYFGLSAPGQDVQEWFRACTTMQIAAHQRGMNTALPEPGGWDENAPSFIQALTTAGHTPTSIIPFTAQALDQGVALNQLLDLIGNQAVPADVLAHPNYHAYTFERLTESGLPAAEAAALIRSRPATTADQDYVQAGIRTAEDLDVLARDGVNSPLALRAHLDGLSCEEWREQVPRVQKFRYKQSGLLDFPLLVQAADEGISLVRWDDNTLETETTKKNPRYGLLYGREERRAQYPWCEVYPDRLLELARAGISPTYLVAFAKLMEKHYAHHAADTSFAETAITAKRKGLTAQMANAISRSDGKLPHPSPHQLLTALESGLSSTAQAHDLASRHSNMDEWITELTTRAERQELVDAWHATVQHAPAWGAVHATAERIHHAAQNKLLRGEPYTKEAATRLLNEQRLDDRQINTLLTWTLHILNGYYFPAISSEWHAEHRPHRDDVADLATSLRDLFTTPHT